jgi:hypothetical protein
MAMRNADKAIVALNDEQVAMVAGGWCGTPYPGWWKVGPVPEPDPIFRTVPTLPAGGIEAPAAFGNIAAIG